MKSKKRINSEYRQALDLLTTLVPNMEIDVLDPIGMAEEIINYIKKPKHINVEEITNWVRSKGGFPAVKWMQENPGLAVGLVKEVIDHLSKNSCLREKTQGGKSIIEKTLAETPENFEDTMINEAVKCFDHTSPDGVPEHLRVTDADFEAAGLPTSPERVSDEELAKIAFNEVTAWMGDVPIDWSWEDAEQEGLIVQARAVRQVVEASKNAEIKALYGRIESAENSWKRWEDSCIKAKSERHVALQEVEKLKKRIDLYEKTIPPDETNRHFQIRKRLGIPASSFSGAAILAVIDERDDLRAKLEEALEQLGSLSSELQNTRAERSQVSAYSDAVCVENASLRAKLKEAEEQVPSFEDMKQDAFMRNLKTFLNEPDEPPADSVTIERLAEIGFDTYCKEKRQKWPSVVTAILRALRPRVAATENELYNVCASNYRGYQSVLDLCNSCIVFGVTEMEG